MNKVMEFGRKAMFYIRVLSGYEERRIRNYRLQIERRLQQAKARQEALNKAPEQIILSEVRRMVEQMQTLNKRLEETEAAIDEYFKPLDAQAEMLMKMQYDSKEKSMEEMMMSMSTQAMEAEPGKGNNMSLKEKSMEEMMLKTLSKQAMEAEAGKNNNVSVNNKAMEEMMIKLAKQAMEAEAGKGDMSVKDMLSAMRKMSPVKKAEPESPAASGTSEDDQVSSSTTNTQKQAQIK